MRLSIETDDITVTIKVPGTYSPDVLSDMAARAIHLFQQSTTIYGTEQPADDDG